MIGIFYHLCTRLSSFCMGGRLSVVSIYEVNMVSSSQVMDIDDDMAGVARLCL